MADMEPSLARAIWHGLEAMNAVAYFAPECRAAPERLGLRGFWMGYFACRAAPMGRVGAGVVEATFANFHPDRVRRAIPAAWDAVGSDELVRARADAAAEALRRLLGGTAEDLAQLVAPVATEVIDRADGAGRALFAADREVDVPDDPVAAMWQHATTLREHRGDAHVALLTGAGLDGCESHVLFVACEGAPAELYQQSRGWSGDDWQGATERLAARGLLTDSGQATPLGRAMRAGIEERTDELAAVPFLGIAEDGVERLLARLESAARRIAAAGEVLFPNPMGLPPPRRRPRPPGRDRSSRRRNGRR